MPDEIHADGHQPDVRITLEEIARPQVDRAYRDGRGVFFAEGVRSVLWAVANGFHIETFIVSDVLLTVSAARKLVRDHRRMGTPTLSVSPEAFRQISTMHHASGVAAVIGQRWFPLHRASPRAGLCWVVLEAVRSEGNLGSLIRTSEAVGGAGLILVGPRIDPFDPGVVRASMGAVFRQAFVRTNHRSLGHWLRRHRCRAVGASPDGTAELHRFEIPSRTVLVFGEERQGLSPSLRDLCTDLVGIPMVGAADSLNLAVAGSLMLYEVYRARSARRAARP